MQTPRTWIAVAPFWAYPTYLTRPAHEVVFQSGDGRTITQCNRVLYSGPLVVVERAHEAALPDHQKCAACI